MKTNILAWVAQEATLPLVRQSERGLSINRPAESLGATDEDLVQALVAITRASAADPAIAELVGATHREGRACVTVADWKLFGEADGTEALYLCIPPERRALPHRLVRLGEVAAGLAHEVSNAVGAIVGWAELARERVQETEARRALERIEGSARIGQAAARKMLEAARGEQPDTEGLVDLSEVLGEVCDILGNQAEDAGVVLRTQLADQLYVAADRSWLFTITWNLVQNALEATRTRGRVEVRASPAGDQVLLEVDDEGPGIPEAKRQRVFEPYFTSKPDGTGLGLALVKRAVKRCGGTIGVKESPRGGARFQVRFPSGAPGRSSVRPPAPPRRHSGIVEKSDFSAARVLIIEDDAAMRELMQTALELQGLTVTTRTSPQSVFDESERYDVALVDLNLAGHRGDQVIARLRERDLIGAAVIVSGEVAPPPLLPAGKPDLWLRKPFELDELFRAVRECVARRSPAATSTRSSA